MLRFLNSILKPLMNEHGHVAPEASTDAPPAPPAAPEPAAAPEPPATPASDDPYELFKGIDPDEGFTKAQLVRRQASPEVRAAMDYLTSRTIQSRLGRVEKKYEGRKYGDKDIEARLAEAKTQWEKEHPAPAAKEVDPDRQAYLDSFTDPQQRADIEKMLELQDRKTAKTEQALREELAKIKGPIDQARTNAETRERDERLQGQADQILEKVPHVDPFTVTDVLKKNEDLPEDQRMETEEMISLINEVEDARFNHILPMRLMAKDAPTLALLDKAVMEGVKKNEPWATELMNKLIASFEEAKRGVPPAERPGAPKPTQPAGTDKWDPDEAMRRGI